MSTVNEQIAKAMGWEVMPENRIWRFRDKDRRTFNLHHWECCKALQAKMVDDGWIVSIEHHVKNWGPDDCAFFVGAMQHEVECDKEYSLWGMSEPAAIVELFCKVYGIK